MIAYHLYEQIEKDFMKTGMTDHQWAQQMQAVADFLCDNFVERSMGLVCDFATNINKVYSAVFPSSPVMQRILNDGTEDAMLFVHHPLIWDIRKAPGVFQLIDRDLLRQFKENRIAIYNLHVPLDNFGEYSTSVSFARALGIKPEQAFAPYFGAMAGIFGATMYQTVHRLRNRLEEMVGHNVSLYNYGDSEIKDSKVAVIAGGGNEVDALTEISETGINVLLTGVALKNAYSMKAHKFAEENGINILGATHYSSEKFACISMVDYFSDLGLHSEFIEDDPVMEDI